MGLFIIRYKKYVIAIGALAFVYEENIPRPFNNIKDDQFPVVLNELYDYFLINTSMKVLMF